MPVSMDVPSSRSLYFYLPQQPLADVVNDTNEPHTAYNSLVDIPAHHIGFRRYERSSDEVAYEELRSLASFRPCNGKGVESR